MQNAATSDEDWDYLYKDYWRDNITNKIRDIDPNINWTPWYDPATQTGYPADTAAINQLLSQPQYIDSLFFGTNKLLNMLIPHMYLLVQKVFMKLELKDLIH